VHLRPNAATGYAYLEARVWPNGPVCPKCGGIDRTGKMKGKSPALACYQCRMWLQAEL
jgi:hypothetical protein